MDAKPLSQPLSEVERPTRAVFVCCDLCEKIRLPLGYISRVANLRHFRNASFMQRLGRTERVVLRYNRNVASYTSRLGKPEDPTVGDRASATDLRHVRALPLDQHEATPGRGRLVCISTTPWRSSRISGRHTCRSRTRNTARQRCTSTPTTPRSFLEMIMMYDRRNCTHITPILKTHNMFFPS